jgi:hypothetical protein
MPALVAGIRVLGASGSKAVDCWNEAGCDDEIPRHTTYLLSGPAKTHVWVCCDHDI